MTAKLSEELQKALHEQGDRPVGEGDRDLLVAEAERFLRDQGDEQ